MAIISSKINIRLDNFIRESNPTDLRKNHNSSCEIGRSSWRANSNARKTIQDSVAYQNPKPKKISLIPTETVGLFHVDRTQVQRGSTLEKIVQNDVNNAKPVAFTLGSVSLMPKLVAYDNSVPLKDVSDNIDVLFDYITSNLCGSNSRNAVKGSINYEYIVNEELSPEMPSVFRENTELSEFCHLRRGTNSEVSMPGINSPMFYVGVAGTSSEVHVEDANLGSINYVWFNYGSGDERPSKLWLIIPDGLALNEAITNEKIVTNPCAYPTNHKNLFVTPAYLRSRRITFDVVLQFPGDIVRVAPGVHHQVINLSCNYAEATNYGCNLWNVAARHVGVCNCTDNHISLIEPNLASRQIVISRNLKVHQCTEPGCRFVEPSLDCWGLHMKNIHGIEKPFRCTECGQRWAMTQQYGRHVCNDEYVDCNICKKRLRGRLDRHLQTASHIRNERAATVASQYQTVRLRPACDHCSRTMTEAELIKHTAHCQGVKCSQCDLKFSTQRSYRRHVKTKHPEP